jgi:biotin operon repressor
MQSIAGPAAALQSPSPTDCRHSREPFDAAFRCINERRDIGPAAKLVHARLVSIHRTGRDETQAEIGDALGMSRHQVWRAVCELVAAGLVQTIRFGLGRPNGYVLLGLAEDDLAGRASASRPAGGAVAGQVRPRARTTSPKEQNRRNRNNYGTKDDARCPRCPHQQHGTTCSRCGCRTYDSSEAVLTRYGPLRV